MAWQPLEQEQGSKSAAWEPLGLDITWPVSRWSSKSFENGIRKGFEIKCLGANRTWKRFKISWSWSSKNVRSQVPVSHGGSKSARGSK